MNTERNICSIARHLLLMVFSAIGIVVASSCSEDGMNGLLVSDQKEGFITINLSNTTLRTRATETEADDMYNEDRLQTANVYLFPATAGDDAVPIFSKRYTMNANESYSVQEKLTRDLLASLFPDGSEGKALAYVVANLPNDYSFPEPITLGALRSLPITSNFATTTRQTSFVMNGEAIISLTYDSANPSKSYVKGDVYLQRAASKITLAVNILKEVVDNNVTWTPVTASMNVLINNGVDGSRVNPTYDVEDLSYFSTSTATSTQIGFTKSGETEDKTSWNCNIPLYTYPNKWDAEHQDKMTFLTLNVRWTNGSSYRNCYYMVPVVKDQQLVRNTAYGVTINVGILGNYTPEEPLELTGVSYRAVDWGSASVDVNIADYRYLVFDRTSFVVNNEAQTAISFYSSHDAEVSVDNVTMTYYAYNTNANGIERKIEITNSINANTKNRNDGEGVYNVYVQSDTDDEDINDVNTVTGTRTLIVNHPLVQWTPHSANTYEVVLGPNVDGTYPAETVMNDRISSINYYTPTDEAAYSTYEFDITISHKDDPSYSETVHIIQYPATYIETDLNESYPTSGTVTTTDLTAARGNLWVNGCQSSNNDTWYAARGLQGNNKNPNMYVLNITMFNEDVYIIGDPRQHASTLLYDTTTGNNSFTATGNTNGTQYGQGWTPAPGIESENTDATDVTKRKLQYYYPTENSTTTKYMVAPKIRVASSYGVCRSAISYLNAQRRCASYQEEQYPAGRWRIPTVGELEYIMILSLQNKIPVLFNSGSTYWTAQGKVTTTLNNNGKLDADDINTK